MRVGWQSLPNWGWGWGTESRRQLLWTADPHLPPGGAGCCLCCGSAPHHYWPEHAAALSSLGGEERMRSGCPEMGSRSPRAEGRATGFSPTQKWEQGSQQSQHLSAFTHSLLKDVFSGSMERVATPLQGAGLGQASALLRVPAVAMPSSRVHSPLRHLPFLSAALTSAPRSKRRCRQGRRSGSSLARSKGLLS